MTSPCSACTQRCCANYTVSVNGYDAWLVATSLRLPPSSFLVHFRVGDEDERGFRLEAGASRYEIALDKAGGYHRGNPCVFWLDFMNGRGRCGIYSVRPRVCQTYPAYQDGDVVLLRDDVLCPEGSWTLAGMDVSLFRKRLYGFRVEQDVYTALVHAWNESLEAAGRPRSIEDYFSHLMSAYDRLDAVRVAAPPETFRELIEAWGRRSPSSPSPLVVDLDFPPAVTGMLARIREAIGLPTVEPPTLAASA